MAKTLSTRKTTVQMSSADGVTIGVCDASYCVEDEGVCLGTKVYRELSPGVSDTVAVTWQNLAATIKSNEGIP